MQKPRRYVLGNQFPSEGFVQTSVEDYFRKLGYIVDTSTDIDLVCRHPQTNERWQIEAKGKTSSCGLDFRTCLGQLVQRINDGETRYGIALPDIPQFRAQIQATSEWAVARLGISWFLVSQDGAVEMLTPRRLQK